MRKRGKMKKTHHLVAYADVLTFFASLFVRLGIECVHPRRSLPSSKFSVYGIILKRMKPLAQRMACFFKMLKISSFWGDTLALITKNRPLRLGLIEAVKHFVIQFSKQFFSNFFLYPKLLMLNKNFKKNKGCEIFVVDKT